MPTVLLKIWPILSDSSFENTGHRFIYGPGEGYIHVLCRAPGRLAARPACPQTRWHTQRPDPPGLPSTPTQVISTPESTTNRQTHNRLTSTGYELCTELVIGSRICAGTLGLSPRMSEMASHSEEFETISSVAGAGFEPTTSGQSLIWLLLGLISGQVVFRVRPSRSLASRG